MAFNDYGVFNGQFLGASSAKPICGVALNLGYNNIYQAKVGAEGLLAGQGVKISNTNTSFQAGAGLNPNVLTITGLAESENGVDGIILSSGTDIVADNGSSAPVAQVGQIVDVAPIGSGVEVYLPCEAGVAGIQIGAKVYYNVTNHTISNTGTDALEGVKVISPVVDGVKVGVTNGVSSFVPTKCVRVKL